MNILSIRVNYWRWNRAAWVETSLMALREPQKTPLLALREYPREILL